MILGEKRGPSAELISGIYLHYGEYLHWLLTGIDRPPVNSARTLPLDSYLNDALKLITDQSISNRSRKGIVKTFVSFYITRLKGIQDTNEYAIELNRVFERFGLQLEKEDIRELYDFLTERTLSLLNIE